jgi:PAS domain S-box-containing protein
LTPHSDRRLAPRSDAGVVDVSVGAIDDSVVITEAGDDAPSLRDLHATEARFRTMVEQVPAIIYTWAIARDADHSTELYVSPQIEDILGYTAAAWMADPDLWRTRVHPDDRDRLITATHRCIADAMPFRLEYRMLHKDGHLVWIRDEAVILDTDPDGRATVFQGVQLDITAEMVGAETLKAMAEERTQLIQVLSHELFTPITAIQGSALTLSAIGERLTPDDLANLADGVSRAATRLRRLVHNLTTAARLDHDNATICRRTLPIGAVLAFALRNISLTAETSRLEVSIDEGLAMCDTTADLSFVVQAFEAVIENAIDYSTNSPVEIVLRRIQDELLVDVSDRGPGVAVELEEKIFELFTQGDSSDSRSHEGLGVGLFLARRIMRLHGGDLAHEPRSGGGSTFTFRFPVAT